MRCLNRNKRKIWFSNYIGQTEIMDEFQNKTGQYAVEYSDPVSILANISAAKGDISTQQFGDDEAYDRVVVYESPDLDIGEHSILWVDVQPQLASKRLVLNEHGEAITPHDYIVKCVARSLNSVSIAISKVNVSG